MDNINKENIMEQVINPRALYTLDEACELLSVSKNTLRRWGASGAIKLAFTPGGHRRVPGHEIERILGTDVTPKVLDEEELARKLEPLRRARESEGEG
jgi:excisionase family DNA binding protein